MEQNLPEDYTTFQVSSALRPSTAEVWEKIEWMWRALDEQKLAMVEVGGTSVKESLANCFKAIQDATWPTGAEIMSIHGATHSYATAQFIEIELYYLSQNEQGANRLSLHRVGTQGGLIYRMCVLPNLQCVLVVGGNSKEIQLRNNRLARLKKLVDLISQLKNNSDELSVRFTEDYETIYRDMVVKLLGEQPKPMVGVLGSAGAGKSTLVNGLIGMRLLPSRKGVQSVTAFPTVLSFADIDGFDIHIEYTALSEVLHLLSTLLDTTAEEDETEGKDPRAVFLKLINSGFTVQATANQKIKMLVEALRKKDLTGLDLSPTLLGVFKGILADEIDFSHQKTFMDVKNFLNDIPDQKNALIKKVTIRARIECLQLVDLVDLPGLGDTIEHRSQLTLHFIKEQCKFIFYVRKERFVEAEADLYKRLLDLRARFAIIYTSFFQLDEASVENLLSHNRKLSNNNIHNFSKCLVAKHFDEIQALRNAGAKIESKTEKKADQSKLSEAYTSSVPIITVDSLWRASGGNSPIEFNGETGTVPLCLSNLPAVQYYLQYTANYFVKMHSDLIAEVMEKWFQSIRAARKKPIITEALLDDLVQRCIDANHKFAIAELDSGELRAYLADFVGRNVYATQTGVASCFQGSNGYVRGRAWKRIVENAIDKWISFPDVNAEFYRALLHTLHKEFDATLMPTASNLIQQVLDYVANSLADLNGHIAAEMGKVEQTAVLEARLPVTVTRRVHGITNAAKNYINSLLDGLLNVVHQTALPRYNFAFSDSGSGVVARVSGMLAEHNFVTEILEAEKEYVVNNWVPGFYEFLTEQAKAILTAVFADAKATFTPLTVGTPVTLAELMAHPDFRAIVELLSGIIDDAKSLR